MGLVIGDSARMEFLQFGDAEGHALGVAGLRLYQIPDEIRHIYRDLVRSTLAAESSQSESILEPLWGCEIDCLRYVESGIEASVVHPVAQHHELPFSLESSN